MKLRRQRRIENNGQTGETAYMVEENLFKNIYLISRIYKELKKLNIHNISSLSSEWTH